MNKCHFNGRIVSDPQLIETSNGNQMCKFTLAVKRKFASTNNQADFINFVAWKSTAKYIAAYAKKGMLCGVSGELQTYTKNGTEKAERPEKGFNIIVEDFEILSTKEEMKRYYNKEEVESSPYQRKESQRIKEVVDDGMNPFDFSAIPF